MIGIRTAVAWCVCVGHENDLPSATEIERHIGRVERNRCNHYAVTLNGSVELHACPRCATD